VSPRRCPGSSGARERTLHAEGDAVLGVDVARRGGRRPGGVDSHSGPPRLAFEPRTASWSPTSRSKQGWPLSAGSIGGVEACGRLRRPSRKGGISLGVLLTGTRSRCAGSFDASRSEAGRTLFPN
jgi:hypothetical protein